MEADFEKKPRLYDLQRICEDAVHWTKQDEWNSTTEKRFFRMVVKRQSRDLETVKGK